MLGEVKRHYEVNGATMPEHDIVEDIEEAKSAFHPDNFSMVTTIMLMRLYDLQLALLSSVNPEQAKYIVELHERGQSFAPAPAFAEYGEAVENADGETDV